MYDFSNMINKSVLRLRFAILVILSAIITLSAFCLFPQKSFAQFVPLNEPGSELYYQYLMRHKALNGFFGGSYQLAPYVGAIEGAPSSYPHWTPNHDVNSLRIFVNPDETFEFGESSSLTNKNSGNGSVNGIERFRGGASLRMSDKFGAYVSFLLDERLADDPNYTGIVWRNLAGFVESGLVSYQSSKLTVLFGRFRNSWGPTTTNPLLSQEAYPLDGMTLRYKAGKRLTYSYTLARLDALTPDSDPLDLNNPAQSDDVFINRYFAAHRVDLHPNNNLRFGLFEIVVFAGAGRGVELQYFNPLNFYHGAQLNETGNDNTFLGFDFDWRFLGSANLYGQLVVDDLQVENEVKGDQEPNELGILTGLYLADVAGQRGWDADLRWEGVTNRTYNQKLERNRYLNHGQPIGHPLGNDFQSYQISFRRWLGGGDALGKSGNTRDAKMDGALTVSSTLLRKGEGRVSDLWSEPWLLSVDPYSESFPTGVIEKTWRHKLTYQRQLSFSDDSQGYLTASLGWESIANLDHQLNQNQSSWLFNLQMSLFFSTDWSLD